MSKFVLKEIDAIKGKQAFFDLEINGVCQFEAFADSVEAKYKSEVTNIVVRMDTVANLGRLPKTKFRDITPKKQLVKEYEFKTKHLRVYAIHLEKKGKVIMLCGYKNNQSSDIKSFRSLKKQFLEEYSHDN